VNYVTTSEVSTVGQVIKFIKPPPKSFLTSEFILVRMLAWMAIYVAAMFGTALGAGYGITQVIAQCETQGTML
jgi:hypothetical protein